MKVESAARRDVSSAEARVTTEARLGAAGATARARRDSVLPTKTGRATTAAEALVRAAILTTRCVCGYETVGDALAGIVQIDCIVARGVVAQVLGGISNFVSQSEDSVGQNHAVWDSGSRSVWRSSQPKMTDPPLRKSDTRRGERRGAARCRLHVRVSAFLLCGRRLLPPLQSPARLRGASPTR